VAAARAAGLPAGERDEGRIQYEWKRQNVAVLTPEVAVLSAEGEAAATTSTGVTFSRPFAQTVVLVRKAGGRKAIHAQQSPPGSVRRIGTPVRGRQRPDAEVKA